jgi:hypothetical protein
MVRTLSKPTKVEMADAAVAPDAAVPAPVPPATPLKIRPELGESEVRFSGTPEEENLFNAQGLPQDQLDIPAYLRKKKK